ncbi:HK97 family phage prohead protease [Cohaesibacter celericrescens]|uniref:HK97 family phage prohead protease n=1 Tax=Cohaesibacter celericrescens TaxID=2067669 RepID=A0A2N5XQL2_9HYPH|nr:HK97 family phage prohead protease [Cohaesibacter celericrescens]PLW76811.1 HK97 family phage prohead protease [Cohaesibacter celericrescens]
MAIKTFNSPLEIKDINEAGEFSGYGSIFGNKDRGGDVVEKGAFANSLQVRGASGVRCLWQHDPEKPVGVFTKIEEDTKGLYVEGRLLIDHVVKAREIYALLQAKAIGGLSIGFRTVRARRDEKSLVRRLFELDLWEISFVTFPMNEAAMVNSVKSIRDLEKRLRDEGGFSRSEAEAISRSGFDGLKTVRDSRDQAGLSSALQRMAEQFGH